MRVWTIQPISFLENLIEKKTLCGSLSHIQEQWSEFIPAYDWMVLMMNKRGLNNNKNYPIWLWNKRPDRRLKMFKYASSAEFVVLELDISTTQILWSDFLDWHCVLSGFPLFNKKNEKEKMRYFKKKYGTACPYMSDLDSQDLTKETLDWEKIFVDISTQKEYTQGCVKEISFSQITKVIKK